MPRRREVPKRKILPDPRFGDVLITKFMNCIMSDGKKSTAEKIVYGSFEVINQRTREDPVAVFRKAIDNTKPMVEVKSRRVGGSTIAPRRSFAAGRPRALRRRRAWP